MENPAYKKMFEGFEGLEPFPLDDADLDKLANCITDTSKFYEKKSGVINSLPEKDDSNIPAGYTYLGQFIIHDISFDSKSDRFTKEHNPWNPIDIAQISNLRNPVFDLENIYGENTGEIPRPDLLAENSLTQLRLAGTFKEPNAGDDPGIYRSYPNDFNRAQDKSANIVDSRNDENFLLAQTQIVFMKFHNAVVNHLLTIEPNAGSNPTDLFNRAREIVIRHYQYIVLTDFLPRVIKNSVLQQAIDIVKSDNHIFYDVSKGLFIPLEFAVAAYRFGHSMIRNSYNLNRLVRRSDASIDQLTLLTGRGQLRDRTKVPSRWLINWKFFYDIDNSSKNADGSKNANFNFAKKINTKFSSALVILMPDSKKYTGNPKSNSLAALDLFRGKLFGLPSGQAVAQKLEKKLKEMQIEMQILSAGQIESNLPKDLQQIFRDKIPLLFYVLAEAEFQNKEEDVGKLGDVGSWIIAETIVRLIWESPFSILKDELKLDKAFSADQKTFGMAEMLKFIAVPARGDFDELNPIG